MKPLKSETSIPCCFLDNKSCFAFFGYRFKFRRQTSTVKGDLSLKQEQLNILKLMSQVTNKMDLTLFAQKVNQDPAAAMANVQQLVDKGLVRKTVSGYGVTGNGKAAIKAFTPLSEDWAFIFYTQIGHPTTFSAKSLAEFYSITGQVGLDSLEFHMARGDFEKWARDSLSDNRLAIEITTVKIANIKGEKLRKELQRVIDQKYNIKELL